jgi:lipoprotein-anchoring transpeptidase ErfK/SrfK
MVVRWKGQRWTTTARELGAQNNAKRIISRVAESQTGLDWQDWARMRWFDEHTSSAEDVRVRYERAAVRSFIDSVADDIDAEPVDAELSIEGDTVSVSQSAVGYRTKRKLATDRLFDRLRGSGRKVSLKVTTLKPETTEGAYDQVLLLDQSEHKLSLHLDGVVAQTWTVATGTGDYPTPIGQYYVTEKRYMPTWVNPSPDTWGKDMPAEIPPGKNNPLGLRALNWNAPAIRFHGTQAVDTLGTDASHGCVRMSNGDVIELYDMVDVGAVIVSRT